MKRAVILASALAMSACDNEAAQNAFPAVPKVAACAQGDRPESALQGQVPAALRANGFAGFNCNLSLLGQWRGEGGSWSMATYEDKAGRVCAYFATAYVKDKAGTPLPRQTPGVPVIDITDPANPTYVTSLTTQAMLNPHESLRLNPRRGVLAGTFGGRGPEIDLYDVTEDCRAPKLLASQAVGTGLDGGGVVFPISPLGHEGSFAPDGQTFYIGEITNGAYDAVDISDLTKPKAITQFDAKTAPFKGEGRNGTAHGLSISEDGNRGYFVSMGYPNPADIMNPNAKLSDGFYIVDTSEVQARKPGAQMKLISATAVKDGSMAQHTLPIRIGGKPYLVFVDEGGAAGEYSPESFKAACDAKLTPFPMARIYDISDETQPKEVSKLALEINDPAYCSNVAPDMAGLSEFTYGSHYCSVDNRHNATAIACAFFNSGIRVFDIRDPVRPKEIAYYNPPGVKEHGPGSGMVMRLMPYKSGGPDLCAAGASFDFKRGTLTTMCTGNGLLVLKFADGVWPFAESTPSAEQTN